MSLKNFLSCKSVIANIVLSASACIVFWGSSVFAWDYMSATADCMPYIAIVLLHIPLVAFAVNLFFKNKIANTVFVVYAVLAILGYAILCALILGALFFALTIIFPIAVAAVLIAFAVYLFLLHKFTKKLRIAVASTALAAIVLYLVFGLFNLRPCYINADPVVFAVGDEYQICWSTSMTATAFVEIDGNYFYDGESGVENSTTVHKVCVPRNVLDSAKHYTVSSRGLICRRTYLSTLGNEHKKSFSFSPVDTSDGLKFYNFSDNHMQRQGVFRASSFWGDELDLIVANGDQFNNISHEYQVTMVYRTLAKISGSGIPVIMTRGNHETVGSIVDSAADFLPSKDGKFYYTTSFGDTMFVILDYATDHDDGETVTRPSHFADYRQKELVWLDELAKSGKPEGINHVVTLSHISFLRLGDRTKDPDCIKFAHLTEKLGTNLLLSGHSHRTELLKSGESYNNTPYVAVLGAIRSDRYADRDTVSEYQFTGTAVAIDDSGFELHFTDSKHRIKASYYF